MDHLPLGQRPSVRVKYRAHSHYGYDQKGFLGFPKRKGIDQAALVERGDHDLDDNCFRAFIQAWMFWGLLSEFMIPPFKIEFERFLEDDDIFGRRITTKNLMASLATWRANLSGRMNPTYFMRLNLVISTAKAVYQSFVVNRSPPSESKLPLEGGHAIAIGILGETLQWALVEAQRSKSLAISGWSLGDGRGWGLALYDRKGVDFQGYCPFDLVFLEGLLKGSMCGFYYATALKPLSYDPQAHSQCNTRHCVADELTGPYQTRHVADCDGSCSFLQPDHDEVVQTVLENGVPVLEYVEHPSSLSVRPRCPGRPYVVVSHVWSDGLGNPKGNAIVACQMKRVAALVDRVSEIRGRRVAFWIDSICVPVDNEMARRKAIGSMFSVYAEAYATIVLSADLMDVEAGENHYLEPAMRIATSKWMRRLWTFQEGVMSRNLYFLFADGLKNIEDLEVLYPQAASESVIASSARSFYTNLLRPRAFKSEADASMVTSVYRSVQWRTTSRASDECLALARVLNIYDPRLLDRSKNGQMEILLRNLPEIPAGLMFMPGARLEHSPFRWAPSTWMIGNEPRDPDPLTVSKASQLPTGYSITFAQSTLTDRGLLVRYPGYRLHCNRRPKSKAACHFTAQFPVDITLRQWYRIEALNLPDDEVKEMLPADENSEDMSSLGIICCRPNPGVMPEAAILVCITGESNGTLHCRWLDLAKINLMTQDGLISRLQKLFTTTDTFWHWYFGETLATDQLWTVD